MITSAEIQSTQYNQLAKQWTVQLRTPIGKRTVICKHLVQATGIASQKPYIPELDNSNPYEGINIHSNEYQNASKLREQGAKVRQDVLKHSLISQKDAGISSKRFVFLVRPGDWIGQHGI